MSRSIHATRRSLEYEERFLYSHSGEQQQKARLELERQQLAKKRWLKKQAKKQRRESAELLPPFAPETVAPESIPIRVLDTCESVHYPATSDDILNVMCLLPAGILDGIASIELCLGHKLPADDPDASIYDVDPFVGRYGYEILPGIFARPYLGTYDPNSCKINIFAYIYDPALPDREMWELYLRLSMLSTFMHEVAHHHNYMTRVAGGRGFGDSQKNEMYAERMEYEWVRQYAIPYLEQTYPEAVRALDAWIQHYGGISIPLSWLAGDPRGTTEIPGIMMLNSFFTIESFVQTLAEDVAKGKNLLETRLGFARDLRYGDYYTEALEILNPIIAEHPNCSEALVSKARIYNYQKKNDEALALAEGVLSKNESNAEAWRVLAYIYRDKQDWPNVLMAANRAVLLYRVGELRWVLMFALRTRARLHLGDFEVAGLEIEYLIQRGQQGWRNSQIHGSKLKKEMQYTMMAGQIKRESVSLD